MKSFFEVVVWLFVRGCVCLRILQMSDAQQTKSGRLSKPSLKRKANHDLNFRALLYGHRPFLQECVSLSLKPKQISDRFRTRFSVDIPSKEISDYISYLKKNGEITVPTTKDTLAEDMVPSPPKRCNVVVFLAFLVMIVSGQTMARAVNDMFNTSEAQEEENEIVVPASPSSSYTTPDESAFDRSLVENLKLFGLLFTKETLTDWIVVFGNTPHYDVAVELHEEDHIVVKIQGGKPSLRSLTASASATKVNPDEWGFPEKEQIVTQFKMFSPAPLSTDISKITTFAFPQENPLHQYYVFPFYQSHMEEKRLKMSHLQIPEE